MRTNITLSFLLLSIGGGVSLASFGQGRVDPPAMGHVASAVLPGGGVAGGGGPANDDCAAAEPLAVAADCSAPVAGSNVGATQSADTPSCDDPTTGIYADVWYTFNSGSHTEVSIDLVPGAGMTDHVLVVLDGCTGSELLCYVLPPSAQTIPVAADTDHVIRVYSNTQFGNPGAFTICVSGGSGETPANDECEEAIAVPVTSDCSSPVSGSNLGSTQSADTPSCDDPTTGIYADVWYMFNSGGHTEVSIDLVPGAGMTDHVLVVLDGCTGSELLCYVLPPSAQTIPVTVDTDYVIRVYSNTQFGSPGAFTICVSDESIIGVAEHAAGSFQVYPNPTDGLVTISATEAAGPAELEVFDPAGRMVHAERLILDGGALATVDLTNLATGHYNLRITMNGSRMVQRLVLD